MGLFDIQREWFAVVGWVSCWAMLICVMLTFDNCADHDTLTFRALRANDNT
jgi:hypothetical protein